jgi:hypothetical protein
VAAEAGTIVVAVAVIAASNPAVTAAPRAAFRLDLEGLALNILVFLPPG